MNNIELRDWFAGQALILLATLITPSDKPKVTGGPLPTIGERTIARVAYAIANEMMLARLEQ